MASTAFLEYVNRWNATRGIKEWLRRGYPALDATPEDNPIVPSTSLYPSPTLLPKG